MKSELVFALENAAWPALLVDRSGVVRRANEAATGLFGAAMEESSTQFAAIWAPENETKAPLFLAQLERASATHFALKFKVKGGETREFSVCVCPVSRDDQKYFLFQFFPPAPSVMSAVVARAEAQEASQAQKQKLDCALQLARTVALDFNNALTSILGHTSLVLSKMEPQNQWRGSLLEVEKSAERAAEIAHDLATFSQQEKEAQAQSAGNLNEIIRRAVEMFRVTAPATLEWKLHLETRLYGVVFDEAKMQQAIVKLLENAAQACVAETGRVTILTRNREITEATPDGRALLAPGRYVVIEVTDNGCGIPAAVLPRVFEPFFTTKPPGQGTGLGLAICLEIVRSHGGDIAVEISAGTGTTVAAWIPAAETKG
jgi:signal transduction histidine kinase